MHGCASYEVNKVGVIAVAILNNYLRIGRNEIAVKVIPALKLVYMMADG